jgi:pimeloyl-ACP methyl ester carboxylesterase
MEATVTVDGVETFYRDEGDGPAVLLLHGVPDSGDLWRHMVPRLHRAGYRTIVPDLRGFGRSARPAEVDCYRLPVVLGDVMAVLRRAQVRRAHVVGHDWGGQLAWLLAAVVPALVDHLVVIGAPHPAELWGAPVPQRERGWYVLLAQFDEAEELVARDGFALLRALLRGGGDIDAYVRDLARPGALTSCLNWYRANYTPAFEVAPPPRLPPIAAPTLAISSPDDHFFVEDVIRSSGRHVRGPWQHHSIAGAGHWIPLDAADEATAVVRGFLASHPRAAGRRRRNGARR